MNGYQNTGRCVLLLFANIKNTSGTAGFFLLPCVEEVKEENIKYIYANQYKHITYNIMALSSGKNNDRRHLLKSESQEAM